MYINPLMINSYLNFHANQKKTGIGHKNDYFTSSFKGKNEEKRLNSLLLTDTKCRHCAEKFLDLEGFNKDIYPVLKNKKLSEIEYLYNLTNQKDSKQELRIPRKDFKVIAALPQETLKLVEPLILAKDDKDKWKFPLTFINYAAKNYNYHQIEVMTQLADCNVNGKNMIFISQNPTINQMKIADKAQTIKKLFGDDLNETYFYSDKNGQNYIEIAVKKQKDSEVFPEDYTLFKVKTDNEFNPINEKKSLNVVNKISENIHENLEHNLYRFDMQDCINAIKEVNKAVPKASHTQILRTMQRLTQFADYGSIKLLEKSLKENNISKVDGESGINKVFSYLINKKQLIKLDNNLDNGYRGIFITHDDLEENRFKELVKDSKTAPNTVFINLEGWSNGINLFNDRNLLTHKTINTLKEARKVQFEHKDYTFDDALSQVLNSDIETKLRESGLNFMTIRLDAPASPEVILKQLNTKLPSSSVINSTIEAVSRHYCGDDDNLNNELSLKIAKYYDENINVISKQGIIETLRKTDEKINEFLDENNLNRENLYFLKPQTSSDMVKSFDLINKMYCELYDVPKDKNIEIYDINDLNKYPKNSTFVVLDDVVGSGSSMIMFGEYMFNARNLDNDKHILFCPVTASKKGIEFINNFLRTIERDKNDKVLNLAETTYDYSSVLNFKDGLEINEKAFGKEGYNKIGMCTTLPYMAPDNNSTLSQYLIQHFLEDKDCIKEKTEILEQLEKEILYYDIFGETKKE